MNIITCKLVVIVICTKINMLLESFLTIFLKKICHRYNPVSSSIRGTVLEVPQWTLMLDEEDREESKKRCQDLKMNKCGKL